MFHFDKHAMLQTKRFLIVETCDEQLLNLIIKQTLDKLPALLVLTITPSKKISQKTYQMVTGGVTNLP